jgi:hypothetical protein
MVAERRRMGAKRQPSLRDAGGNMGQLRGAVGTNRPPYNGRYGIVRTGETVRSRNMVGRRSSPPFSKRQRPISSEAFPRSTSEPPPAQCIPRDALTHWMLGVRCSPLSPNRSNGP